MQSPKKMKTEIEKIAKQILAQEEKPNYTNSDFVNATIIFQSALMDKMYDKQTFDKIDFDQRVQMAESCGLDLRNLINKYTGLDLHNLEQIL